MGKLFRFLAGAAIGTGLGFAGAILFAPQSGEELKSKLKARREQAIAAAKAESAERERELRAEWQARVEAETIKREALRG